MNEILVHALDNFHTITLFATVKTFEDSSLELFKKTKSQLQNISRHIYQRYTNLRIINTNLDFNQQPNTHPIIQTTSKHQIKVQQHRNKNIEQEVLQSNSNSQIKQQKIQDKNATNFCRRGYHLIDVEQEQSDQIQLSLEEEQDDQSSLNLNDKDYVNPSTKKYSEQLEKQVEIIEARIKAIQENPNKKKRKRSPMTEKALSKVIKLFQLYQKCQNSELQSNRKITMNIIADRLGYCYTTIYQLYKDYQFDSTLSQRFIRLRRNKGNDPDSELTKRRMQAIKSILLQNPFRTQNQVAIIMNKNEQLKYNGKQIKTKNVSSLLKIMRYSKKKIVKIPKFRNTPQNIERRFNYCQKYKKLVDSKQRLYFLDQSAFNLFTIRDMAWSKKSQPVQQKVQFPKGKNVSLIAIMSETGIVAWEVKNGNFRKEHHLAFIQKFVARMNNQSKEKKEYLIMDNCKIHDQHRTQQLTDKNQVIQIISLPPYSPQLNPIENWFHQLKCRVRKCVFQNQEQLVAQIKKSIQFYKNYDFSNYFRGAMSHVMKGLLRENF